MTEYERCLRVWSNWQRGAPQEIQNRIPAYHRIQSFHTVKLDYPSLNFAAATTMWDTGKMTNYTGELQPILAVNNYRIASFLAETCLKYKEPLSLDLVCGIQHALTCGLYGTQLYVIQEDRPGEFKQSDQVSGLIDVGASPDEIEEVLSALIDDMPRIADLNDTLVAAAYLHARIAFIKPFAVGNGMVSRLVTNYWLRLQGHPPVMIPSGESARYQKCLELFDVQEDIEPLAVFMSEKVEQYWAPQMSAPEQTKSGPKFTLRI